MRDYLVTLLIFGSLPFILARPYIGVLVWSWISYMNPHRLTWSFAYDMPFAKIVAITLFVSLLFSRDVRRPPLTGLTFIWLMFIVWMAITTAFAIFPSVAQEELVLVLKIQVIILLTMMVLRTPQRVHILIWVIFLSVGFFGIKGGIFTIATAGSHLVWGPAQSFIVDNNSLAVALLMVIPLGYYLFLQEKRRLVKLALLGAMALIAVSVVGSHSRGAFLAIMAVAVFLWWKSKNRVIIGLGVLPLLPVLFFAMPESWHERMATISEYEQDASAMGRINAWTYSINVANARLTGAGYEAWSKETFARWAPVPEDVHAAHSIYFSVLADHGWIGLVFFVAIFWGAWRLANKIIRAAEEHDEHRWMSDLSRMFQVTLVAYFVGGAFLSLSYFDLPWHVVSILVIMRAMLEEQGVPVTAAARRQQADALRRNQGRYA